MPTDSETGSVTDWAPPIERDTSFTPRGRAA